MNDFKKKKIGKGKKMKKKRKKKRNRKKKRGKFQKKKLLTASPNSGQPTSVSKAQTYRQGPMHLPQRQAKIKYKNALRGN
jgi:hypothetical protein